MTTNLRISLTILSVGFAIEGGGEAYSLVSKGGTSAGNERRIPTLGGRERPRTAVPLSRSA